MLSARYFFLSYKKKFVTKFVTCITKFVTRITKFVTCVRKFVTKSVCQIVKNNKEKGKIFTGIVRFCLGIILTFCRIAAMMI